MRSLFYIVMLLLITGCGYSGSQDVHGLDAAQAMMDHDPAGALERLNSYDVAEFRDSATMARWALLYSEALAANSLTVPTDTIINIAITYYDAHNDAETVERARRAKTLLAASDRSNALASALYLQKEKEFLLYKERTKKEQALCITVIIALVAAGIIAWQRQRIKLNEARSEALIAEAAAMSRRLSASLHNRFAMIDELCETYYESQGTAAERKAIAGKVRAQIEALKSDEGVFTEMEKCNEEFLQKIRQELPGLKRDEYRLMVYLVSGLSNRTIALLIGESIDTAYKRKSRLKARISASEAPGRELFLTVFSGGQNFSALSKETPCK